METEDAKRRHFVDLFAGCGGLSLGLEEAGFEPVLVNEINSDALETYLVNRDDRYPLLRTKYCSRDIHELTSNDCVLLAEMAVNFAADYGFSFQSGDLDLVVGGPPCQGYSGIGHRRSFPVEKRGIPSNHLYKEMVTVIRFLRPKMFLFENVRGVLHGKWHPSGCSGEIWTDVMGEFQAIPDYRIETRLVRGSEFGVPQNRPRVLLVGIRSDIDALFAQLGDKPRLIPDLSIPPPDLVDLLSDLIDPEYENGGETRYYPSDPMSEIQKRFRSPRPDSSPSERGVLTDHKYSKHSEAVLAKFRWLQNGGDPDDPQFRTKKFSQRVVPSRWDAKGPSITATSMPDDYIHFSQPRTLTVREWARLQTFPDWYRFEGKRTTGGQRRAGNPMAGHFEREAPKYTQIGNAVPVKMAFEIGKHLRTLLDYEES